MSIPDIKEKLHEYIEQGDQRLLKMIYALIREYHDEEYFDIEDSRKKLIQTECEKYLKGEGKSYSWKEIKNMAINKQGPHAI